MVASPRQGHHVKFFRLVITKGGAVAKQLRRRTSDQTVLDSNPAVAAVLSPWTRLFTPIVPRRSLHISFYELSCHPCKIYTGKKKNFLTARPYQSVSLCVLVADGARFLDIITGRGWHSRSGSRIKPAVIELLTRNKIRYVNKTYWSSLYFKNVGEKKEMLPCNFDKRTIFLSFVKLYSFERKCPVSPVNKCSVSRCHLTHHTIFSKDLSHVLLSSYQVE